MSYRFAISTLSEILKVVNDGERGFALCAAHAQSHELRDAFSAAAIRYAAAAAELRTLLERLGWDPAVHRAAWLAPRRAWQQLRTILALNDDEALVELCGRGEDHALEVYRNALDDPLPEFVRPVVLRQFESVMSEHPQMRVEPEERVAGTMPFASEGGHARS